MWDTMKSTPYSPIKPLLLLVLGVALVTAWTSRPASAADCKRGDLDTRFCDEDGDLIADVPKDKSQIVDPGTLIFSYTPVEDPAVYKKVWEGFMDHIAKATGKKIQFFSVQSNAAQIEAMRAGRLHVAGFNTGSNPLAVNCAGFVPFSMMASKDDSFGYEMEIITHMDSPIKKVEDVKGRTLAFTSETSNSGFKAPSALLRSEFNLVAERDFKPAFSGKHDNSILGVYNKDYDAAAIANTVLERMDARGVVDRKKLRTIYKSQTFPTTGFGHVYNLEPGLAKKIREAFFSFKWEGTELEKEFSKSGEAKFIPITFQKHWEVIRKIDKAMDVSYTCK
ncbi:MAG: phosphate/phosphite/phosphonate ABC transporter substrate-binding protein [Deltaproteobacteria bacterium]|nr:phosphate/phosphite/phosphonate ABC transporter substrate-binding protein [Deltaproteobacteria bacterium]